jgi:CotS family spore coat protein
VVQPDVNWSARELYAIMGEFGVEPQGFTPVRRAWRVETATGPLFLKVARLTPPELGFVAAALAYLADRGEAVPHLRRDYLDRPWAARGDCAFLLSDWVEGREASFLNPADLAPAVEAVARLHRSGEGFQAPRTGAGRVEWGRWPEKFGRRAAQLEIFRREAEAAGGPFDRAWLALWPGHAAQATRALRLLGRSEYPRLSATGRRPVICHHDLSERNFLVSGDGQARLVDFDYCLQDFALHDLANLLQRQGQATGWQVAAARLALGAYDRQRPLTRPERGLLLVFLAWPHRYWLLGWQRYVERLGWPEARWLDAAAKRTEEAPVREGFLGALSGMLDAE